MLVTLAGIVMLPCILPGTWMSVVWFLLNNTPPRLLYAIFDEATVMFVSAEQPKNALIPMLVTLEGIVMLVRPKQP
jgi:hypothetical protein